MSLMVLTLHIARAQSPENNSTKQVFTLEEAVSYALANSNSARNSAIDEQIADARVKETRGIGLPQIDATAGITHNIRIQRFFNQAGIVGSFTGQEIEGVAPSDVVAATNPFQLKSAGTASVTASQIIFNGSYLVGLQAARAYRDLSVKSSRLTQEDIVVQVTKAFYTTLINTERMKLFDSNLARVDSLLRTTTALYENGLAESVDVDRVRVTLNNLKVERSNFENLQRVSTELLKFQMNYPMDREITINGSINDIAVPESAEAFGGESEYAQRADYQVLMANKKLQYLNLRNKYAEGLPQLLAQGTFGYFTQSGDISGIFRTETGNSPDFSDQLGPDKWYSYSNVGVNLVIPIFSGLQRSYRVQQAKLELQKVDNNEQMLKSRIDFEVKQARLTYDNSLKSLLAQQENLDLAQNVARITKIKFEEGVGSSMEVIDAENSLRETQINYYNALYDALVAKVDLDKAFGKFTPTTNNEK